MKARVPFPMNGGIDWAMDFHLLGSYDLMTRMGNSSNHRFDLMMMPPGLLGPYLYDCWIVESLKWEAPSLLVNC
jgi:hypothetical protein